MTFYLIGLGLNLQSISVEALESLKTCKKIYLESYTVDFPYTIKDLEKSLNQKIIPLSREPVESEKFLDEAKKQDIALLVYGDSLSATTHISLIEKCKKEKIPFKIFHNSSILTAISETGLQLYKFGRVASMPKFQKNFEPDSFIDIIADNQKIKAHSLLLTDIGLSSTQALTQLEQVLEKRKIKFDKIIMASQLGTEKSKIYYDTIKKIKTQNIALPFCIIIPSDLHFTEKEFLENFA